jgi:hypothetical protein
MAPIIHDRHLTLSEVKNNTRSRPFKVTDVTDRENNYNTSSNGKGTLKVTICGNQQHKYIPQSWSNNITKEAPSTV